MFRSNLLILAFFLSSCISFKPDTKSKWAPLGQAQSVDCELVKLQPGDLELTDLHEFTDEKTKVKSVLTKTRKRNGLTGYSLRKLSGNEVSSDQPQTLSWGRKARYIGQIYIENTTYVVVESIDKDNFKRLEIRDLQSNVVKYSSSRLPYSFYTKALYPSKKGVWILFKSRVSRVSDDDLPVKIIDGTLSDKGEIAFNQKSYLAMKGESKFFGFGHGRLAVFSLKKSKNTKKMGFSYNIIDQIGSESTEYAVGEEPIDRVESWAISKHRDGLVLAFLSGDTLIWDNAKLNILVFDQQGDVLWRKEFSIEGEHVGEPVLVSGATKTRLLLPKWLDSESTIHLLEVGRAEVVDKGYHGVFREGTFLYKGFLGDGDDLNLVFRFPKGFSKGHKICEIEG